VPVVIPMGKEENFRGIIDLITMKAIFYDEESQGVKYHEEDIPRTSLRRRRSGAPISLRSAPNRTTCSFRSFWITAS